MLKGKLTSVRARLGRPRSSRQGFHPSTSQGEKPFGVHLPAYRVLGRKIFERSSADVFILLATADITDVMRQSRPVLA